MSRTFGVSLASDFQPVGQLSTIMAAKLKSFSQRGRPQIKIILNDFEDSEIPHYSTMDKIEGKVIVTSPVTTTLEKLSIDFIGLSKTYVERVTASTAMSGRSEARHQFLKLVQPLPESSYPENRVLLANQEYEFPFIFVVPQQLLPRVCRHTVASSTVQQEHLRLPPSFGESTIAGHGQKLLCDGAPDMARIKYMVTAKVVEGDSCPQDPMTAEKMVRVIPAVDAHPPFDTESPESDYIMRTEKDVRKGIFQGKLGRLVVESAQPRPLSVPALDGTAPDSKVITVNLRFDPSDKKNPPPKLSTLSTKLKVSTFFASTARMKLATKHDASWDLNQGLHTESISLASRCVANVEWKWNHASEEDRLSDFRRRSSVASSTLSDSQLVPEPSTKYKGEGFWTATIVAPVSLPDNRAWVPTFHTCLISRIYGLGMHLSLGSGSVTGVDLKLPLQLTSPGTHRTMSQVASLTAQELAMEAMDADEFFAPRTISPMPAGFAGRSSIGAPAAQQDLPPGYDAFPRASNRAAVAV